MANTYIPEDKVHIIIPKLPDDEMGFKVDQYEHVTINGNTTLIRRGEHVDVSPEADMQLRNKYPTL